MLGSTKDGPILAPSKNAPIIAKRGQRQDSLASQANLCSVRAQTDQHVLWLRIKCAYFNFLTQRHIFPEAEVSTDDQRLHRPLMLPLRQEDVQEAVRRLEHFFSLGNAQATDGTDDYAFGYQYDDVGSDDRSESSDASDIGCSVTVSLPIRVEDVPAAQRNLKLFLSGSEIGQTKYRLQIKSSAPVNSDARELEHADANEGSFHLVESASESETCPDSYIKPAATSRAITEALESAAALHVEKDLGIESAQQLTLGCVTPAWLVALTATSIMQDINGNRLAPHLTEAESLEDEYTLIEGMLKQESSAFSVVSISPTEDGGMQSTSPEISPVLVEIESGIGVNHKSSNNLPTTVHQADNELHNMGAHQVHDNRDVDATLQCMDGTDVLIEELSATPDFVAVHTNIRDLLPNQIETFKLGDDHAQENAAIVPEDSGFFYASASPTEDRRTQTRLDLYPDPASGKAAMLKVDSTNLSSPIAEPINGVGKEMSPSALRSPGSNLGLKLGALPAFASMPRRTFQDKLIDLKSKRGNGEAQQTLAGSPLSQQVAEDDDP